MALLPCRSCGGVESTLTLVGYCYPCFSRFGSMPKVAMLLLALNPYLSVEEFQRALRIEQRAWAEAEYATVRAALDAVYGRRKHAALV